MRTVIRASGVIAIVGLLLQPPPLLAQTVEELESSLHVDRGLEAEGEPVLGTFTLVLLGVVLLAVAAIFLFGLRASGRVQDRGPPTVGEGEGESYFLHVAFLAAGYAAIIIMLAYLPPAMTPAWGTTTRWVLIVAAMIISAAHVLGARDERALPPYLKYLFSGGIITAAFFFHLAFKKWEFLKFSDPFYHGKGPYVALGLLLLLVLLYSAHITWHHYKLNRED